MGPQPALPVPRRVSFLALLTRVLFLASVPTQAHDHDEFVRPAPPFYLPPPPSENATQLETGYNPWMVKYTGTPSGHPVDVKTHVLMTGGCLPVEEGGSEFYQDAGTGFRLRCAELNIVCQCRPIIWGDKMNPPLLLEDGTRDDSIFQGTHQCVWEIRRLLNEHKQGLINVGGISVKCTYADPDVFAEAEELGVPLFLLGLNKPDPERVPSEAEFVQGPQPTGFIGTDQAFLGRTMARLLKQLRPGGGKYAFVMDWFSQGMFRRSAGFVEEMERDHHLEGRAQWHQIPDYPFDTATANFDDCPYVECMMNGLSDPVNGPEQLDAIIFLFQSPLRTESNYTQWVDQLDRNITLIAMDAVDYLEYLTTGYVDGLVGQITYEMGTRSAEVLSQVSARGIADSDNADGVVLPANLQFESRLVAYNLIPLELDKVHPIQLDQNLLEGLSIVGFVCFGVVVVSVALCLLWTIWFRSNRVVIAAQPLFLFVLLAGIVLLSSSMVPLSFDDKGDPTSMSKTRAVGICMSVPWLAFSGFAVIFSALFSKTWRVNRLFQRGNPMVRKKVSAADVLGPFVVIFTANVVVLLCWTLIDPLEYTRLPGDGTDFWNREIESYGSCRSNEKALPFLIPLAFINFSVLSISCWQAFEARGLESEFAESRYIGMAVGVLFQAFLTVFPVVGVVGKEDPRASYLVLVLGIFVVAESVLLLIFVPKMHLGRQYARMSEQEQRKSMSILIRGASRRQSSTKSSLGFDIEGASAEAAKGGSSSRSTEKPGSDLDASAVKSEEDGQQKRPSVSFSTTDNSRPLADVSEHSSLHSFDRQGTPEPIVRVSQTELR